METTSDSGTGTPTLCHKFFSSASLAPAFGVAVVSTSGLREYFGIGIETIRNNSSARAARSGVGYTGILNWANFFAANGASDCAPVRATTIGKDLTFPAAPSALAILSTSSPTRTQNAAIIASTFISFTNIDIHFSNSSGDEITAAVTSTGLVEFP